MSKSATVDVYVKLPHGIIAGDGVCGINPKGEVVMALDSGPLHLKAGITENVPRALIEEWLARNSTLAAVKRGDVRILDGDRIAVDSSRK